MTSTRLPGKVLRELGGNKTTLQYLVERLERCQSVDEVIIATSKEPTDDPLVEACEKLGVKCLRGPLLDVAGRYREVVDHFGLDAFVRVTGDSPLLDQRLVDRGVELFKDGEWDVVTNVFPSTFPSGQSLEVVAANAFRVALDKMSEPDEFEHVTRWFYKHSDEVRILNFTQERDEGYMDVSLDTEEDAELIAAIFARMDRPHWDYTAAEVADLCREVQQR
jgi:spore coat polysaccharide biosynthesis protein SpsF